MPQIIGLYNIFHYSYFIFHLLRLLCKTSNPPFLQILNFIFLLHHLLIFNLVFLLHKIHSLFHLINPISYLSIDCLFPLKPLKILKRLRRKKANRLRHLSNLIYLNIGYSWMQGKAGVIFFACLFDVDEWIMEGLLLCIEMLLEEGLIAWEKITGCALLELERGVGFEAWLGVEFAGLSILPVAHIILLLLEFIIGFIRLLKNVKGMKIMGQVFGG